MVSVVKTNESTQADLAEQLQYMSGFANEHWLIQDDLPNSCKRILKLVILWVSDPFASR